MKTILAASTLALALAGPAFAQTSQITPSQAIGNASILPSGQSNGVLPPADGGSGSNNAIGSGGTVDRNTTQSVIANPAPNSTLRDLSQPGTSLSGGVAPQSSGGIPNTLNGTSVPGSTTTGPAAGGSSAY